jgi:hypothetical protein
MDGLGRWPGVAGFVTLAGRSLLDLPGMQDVQESRCPVGPQQDLSFQAGLRAAARATSAQRSFLARWNPVARQYGQTTLSPGQF